MAIQTRSARGRSTSRGARSNGRSTSRTAAAAESTRSGTPRGRGGRGRGGRGRGGRGRSAPRAASSPRTGSGEDDVSDAVDELRQRVDELQEELANRAGANLQLQAEIDDLRRSRPGTDTMDVVAGAEEAEVIVTDMAPPPPRASGQAQLRQFKLKEDMRAWNNPINSKRWLLTGTRPVATGLSLQGMMGVLHDVADVSTAVLGMLNDLSGFDIREFVAPGDDRTATDRLLTEHFEILISAVVKLISKGVTSSGGKARVVILEEGFRSGLRQLRQHCVECRSRMRIGANFTKMADLVNLDLNRWAGRLFDEATDFAALYDSPPSVRDFPDVVVPEWTRLSQYIGAGGLRNSQHHPRSQSLPPTYGRDRSTTLPSGKKGYCFAWASAAGCGRQARNCDWEHAPDPFNGGGGRGRGGGNRGGGRGGADRSDSKERASGGGGNGSGGGGGGAGSTRN